jgi:hypothetical protein
MWTNNKVVMKLGSQDELVGSDEVRFSGWVSWQFLFTCGVVPVRKVWRYQKGNQKP